MRLALVKERTRMTHSGSAAKYFVYEIGCGGKKVLFRRVTHERESIAFFINGARPARLRTGSAYVHRRWIRGGASCEGSVRCWCVSGPVFSFHDYNLHIINIFKLLVRLLTENRVRRIQRCDWKIFRVIGRYWTNENVHFGTHLNFLLLQERHGDGGKNTWCADRCGALHGKIRLIIGAIVFE